MQCYYAIASCSCCECLFVITTFRVFRSIPCEGFACGSGCIHFNFIIDGQMQFDRTVATSNRGEYFFIIATFSVFRSVPCEGLACGSDGIHFDFIIDGQMQFDRTVAARNGGEGLFIIATCCVFCTVPCEGLTCGCRCIDSDFIIDGQMQFDRTVATGNGGEGLFVVATGSIFCVVPCEGLTCSSSGIGLLTNHRCVRQNTNGSRGSVTMVANDYRHIGLISDQLTSSWGLTYHIDFTIIGSMFDDKLREVWYHTLITSGVGRCLQPTFDNRCGFVDHSKGLRVAIIHHLTIYINIGAHNVCMVRDEMRVLIRWFEITTILSVIVNQAGDVRTSILRWMDITCHLIECHIATVCWQNKR